MSHVIMDSVGEGTHVRLLVELIHYPVQELDVGLMQVLHPLRQLRTAAWLACIVQHLLVPIIDGSHKRPSKLFPAAYAEIYSCKFSRRNQPGISCCESSGTMLQALPFSQILECQARSSLKLPTSSIADLQNNLEANSQCFSAANADCRCCWPMRSKRFSAPAHADP